MAWLVHKKKKPSDGFDEPRVGGVRGHPTHPVSSFIPIHFNYAVIPALFPVSWLAQPGNLQLIWPHLRFSRGGGRESSRNGMKCHSVVAFVTKMLGGDAEWLGRSLKTCAAGCSVVLQQKWTAIWAPALLCPFCPPFKLQASLSWTQKKKNPAASCRLPCTSWCSAPHHGFFTFFTEDELDADSLRLRCNVMHKTVTSGSGKCFFLAQDIK